jgi:antitoxin component YwqK of YwqJK toxin-antitoxin module
MRATWQNLARRAGCVLLLVAAVLTLEAAHAAPSMALARVERRELELRAGVLTQHGHPFTGEAVEYYADGGVRSIERFEAGRRHGESRGWYETGSLEYVRPFIHGREHGVHLGWWENGVRRFVYRFEGGLQQGTSREWFSDGTPFRVFNYQDGLEAGPQKMWYADGTLRASYVVRDGRRYGLMGAKGCVTDSAEVAA